MAKVDVVSAGVTAVQSAEVQALSDALGSAYDAGALDQKASDGTLSQADLDAAVAAAKLDDAKMLADAQASMVALQSSFDVLSQSKLLEDSIVAGLQASLDSLHAAIKNLESLFVQP